MPRMSDDMMRDDDMTLLTADKVAVRYGGQSVLDKVTLALTPGEIVTIVGPNGSGKSTLLRVLIGALQPTGGQVTRAKGLKIGYVPQKLHIDPSMPLTVRRFLDLPQKVSDAQAREALETAGLSDLRNRQMGDLSGGQFQRVLLARAILGKPDLLMLDEATQGLDQPGSASFYRQIEAVRQELGCAVLMVSHEFAAPAYRELFGTGTGGALALYRHDHDHHHHDHDHDHRHDHDHTHHHDHEAAD